MDSTPETNSEESILYELLVYSEWAQEQEVLNKLANTNSWSWKAVTHYLKSFSAAQHIADWVNQQLPWLFAVGADGRAVAILQDAMLEIRTVRDSYAAPIGKTYVSKEPWPQWRRLQWSPDGTLLACARSNGQVDVYDLLASPLFEIAAPSGCANGPAPAATDKKNHPPGALAQLVFIDTRTKNAHWSYELLCLDFYGQLRAYFVSPTQGFAPSHTFSFSSVLPGGITTACGDHLRHLLIVAAAVGSGTNHGEDSEVLTGSDSGLTLWRILDDSPYYSQVPLVTSKERGALSQRRWLPSFAQVHYGNSVVKMSLSPDGSSLAGVHLSGAVSVWALPSLSCRHYWPLQRQPGYDELSPALLQLPAHRRVRSPFLQNPYKFHPVDVDWWSSESIILARCSGAVTVCSVTDLHNKLGASAEFFDGSPRIGPACDGTFLGIECEARVQRKRPPTSSVDEGSVTATAAKSLVDDEDEAAGGVREADVSSDEEDQSGKQAVLQRMTRSLLYWVTDSERFQPPRKRHRTVSRTYRLLGFKRTTPDELYMWKLDAEEYGEALALARAYGLDCDLVYQRQWRNTKATITAIHDYLSKVRKRNWVLRECLERVPDDIDAARELLLYGLKNTQLSIVAQMTTPPGSPSSLPVHAIDSVVEVDDSDDEANERALAHERQLLSRIDWANLSVDQKLLVSTRRRLLQFLDRLDVYEIILGGTHYAAERYDSAFFQHFRGQSAFEAAAEFARRSEWQAVATLFTFSGDRTLPHRLAICSCFPETLPPFEYRSLLPECDPAGRVVFPWRQQRLRDPADWSESAEARAAVTADQELESRALDKFYSEETNNTWLPFRLQQPDEELTPRQVGQWYALRAIDIDRRSRLVEHALDLVKLGLERNVPLLDEVQHQLLTLETLVYDTHQSAVTLEQLQATSQPEVVRLLTASATTDTFLSVYRRWLAPYLARVEALTPGRRHELLRDLLLTKSRDSLEWTLQVVENSKTGQQDPVVADSFQLMSLAVDCIYSCQLTDQLELAMKIYDCLPERPFRPSDELSRMHDQLDLLQTRLEAAYTLDQYGVALTPAQIATKQEDVDQVEQLFVRLARTVVRKTGQFNESHYREILQDMLSLQETVFDCISAQLCYEILVGSLLSCSNKESIAWAGQLLQVRPDQQRQDANEEQQQLQQQHQQLQQQQQQQQAKRQEPSDEEEEEQQPVLSAIPYSRSKQLVLQAAQEYFNSSENLLDPGLELASFCLGLMATEEDEDIQAEKDLISAVHLMADYGLDMPPLKIRLTQDRLQLIDLVLQHGGKAYRNASRLLRLGQLLRCSGTSGPAAAAAAGSSASSSASAAASGPIYVRIAEAALVRRDLDTACQMCSKLRAANEPTGWSVCRRLADDDEVVDLTLRRGLVAFALTHCPAECIEDLLRLSWHLERRQLTDASVRHMEMLMTYEDGDPAFLALLDADCVDAYRRNADLEGRKSSTTQQLSISEVPQFLDSTWLTLFSGQVHAVKNTLTRTVTAPKVEAAASNGDCDKIGLPVFYWSRWMADGSNETELHESRLLATGYRSYAASPTGRVDTRLELLTSGRRMQILDALRRPYEFWNGAGDQLLVRLAETIFPDDAVLALGHWLELRRPEESWPAWTRLPSTEITLQLAAYYFALQAVRWDSTVDPTAMSQLLTWSPRRLVDRAMAELDAGDAPLVALLKRSLRLLADVSEAQQLRRLDGGVDIGRFASDDQYKRDTIVGLAITTDATVFAAAVRLASHYAIPAWQVAFSHLTALFGADEEADADRLRQHLDRHGLVETLMSDEEEFGRRMMDVVLPSVSGRDHPRLRLFHRLMESRPALARLLPVAPAFCLELLDLLDKLPRPAASKTPRVDLKKLIASPEDFVGQMAAVLDADSVSIFSKLAKRVAAATGMRIDAGTVHSAWALKYFFQLAEPLQAGDKPPTAVDWLHRFETCRGHVQKLDTAQVLDLVDGLCFSERALDLLTLEVRHDLCRRCLKAVQQRKPPTAKASGAKTKKDKPVLDDSAKWSETLSALQRWCNHLDRLMRSDQYVEMRGSVLRCSGGADLWRQFERSRADESALHRLLLRLLIDDRPTEMLRSFVAIFPTTCSWSPEEVLVDAIGLTLGHLRGAEEPLLTNRDALSVLMKLVARADRLMAEDDAVLMSQSDVEDLLRQFYEDDAVDVALRLRLLEMLPAEYQPPSDAVEGAGNRIQLLRTLAAVRKAWADDVEVTEWSRQLCETDVDTQERRSALATRLLELCRTALHFAALAELLHTWPPFVSISDPDSCPWLLLWRAILSRKTSELTDSDLSLRTIRLALQQKPPLSDQCLTAMYEAAEAALNSTRLCLNIGLTADVGKLEDRALHALNARVAPFNLISAADYDTELLEGVLQRPHLVGRLAGTCLYGPLCERLLSLDADDDDRDDDEAAPRVRDIARQLAESGHRARAGHLLQLTDRLPRYLLNFSSALYFASHKKL